MLIVGYCYGIRHERRLGEEVKPHPAYRWQSHITGMMLYERCIMGKWLGMLKKIAPRLSRVAFVGNPKFRGYDYFLRSAEAAAPALAIELIPTPITLSTIPGDQAFQPLKESGCPLVTQR